MNFIISITCVCLHEGMYIICIQMPTEAEDMDSLRTGVKGNSELPDVGA